MHLHHITVNTGHSRRSERGEVSDDIIRIMRQWLDDMSAGGVRALTNNGNVACRLGRHNGKMAEFVVSIGHGAQTDALRFVVCRHSKYKAEAWTLAGGQGNPPQTPFLAVKLLMPEAEMMTLGASLEDIFMLGDFERCIAWAWLDRGFQAA